MSALLEISGLNVSFGTVRAVRQFDLTVRHGETLALVGESGCGKSTTALAIMRLLRDEVNVSGRVLFEGRDLLRLPPAEMRKLRGSAISMIFQDPMTSLNPVLTVGEQIEESLRLHAGLKGRAARERAIELLSMVEIPDAARRANDYPHQFSGGQRQRAMIAMAVACNPRLLIADEPTTALDVTIQAKILELLDRLKREFSMALLLITHDLGVVGQWADRVAVMYRGAKVEEADTGQLFRRPQHAYTRGLLRTALALDHDVHYRNTRLAEIRPDFSADVRHRPRPSQNEYPQDPVLQVTNLHTRYVMRDRTVKAVNGVSFEIGRGETVGLVGESGCGKSTLSKTIMRLVPSESGSIVLEGTDITTLSERALKPHRRRIQMIFQDPYASLNPRQSVRQILDTALKVHELGDRAERNDRIRHIIDRVGLSPDALDRYPHEFSGGQRQRIGVARALVLQPSLVICDEPVSSLDVSIRAQILNLLVDLKDELGLSYLFISHDLSVVRYIADRVLVMYAGRIVEAGHHRTIWSNPQHPYTRSLIDAVPAVPDAARPQSRLLEMQ